MSNAEKMVSEDLIRAILGNAAQGYFSKDHGDQLRAILDQPAEQHQGEPVALPARKDPTEAWAIPVGVHKAEGWNACLDEIAKLGPLYSRPVQDEPVAWRGLNDLGEVVTEWIDGVPPESIVDLCGNPASFAKIEQAYSHADPGEAERLRKEVAELEQLRRDDLGRHLITEVKTESQQAAVQAKADLEGTLSIVRTSCVRGKP